MSVRIDTRAGARTNATARGGGPDPRSEMIRIHLSRYRELSSQGKWAEADKELRAIEAVVK